MLVTQFFEKSGITCTFTVLHVTLSSDGSRIIVYAVEGVLILKVQMHFMCIHIKQSSIV